MAKLFGLSGRVTGRKGDTVFSVRKGEQIIRQYNPMVLNPNTEAQTVQRAKMKLSSQLGAIFANVIAIPSEGAKTSRNIFTKINFPLITRSSDPDFIKVEADLPNIQLTKSGRSMIPFAAGRDSVNGKIYCLLTQDGADSFDQVVYVMMQVLSDGTIMFLDSKVIKEAGASGKFVASFDDPRENVLIYAYGIQDLNAMAKTTFDNTQYENGTDIASLISGRVVSANDAQVSMTAGLLFEKTASITASAGTFSIMVVNAAPDVAPLIGEGVYEEDVSADNMFIAPEGKKVAGWYAQNGVNYGRNVIPYHTLTAGICSVLTPCVCNTNEKYVAVMHDNTVNVTGGGAFTSGNSAEIEATPVTGYEFVKWVVNGTDVATNPTTVTVNAFDWGFAQCITQLED